MNSFYSENCLPAFQVLAFVQCWCYIHLEVGCHRHQWYPVKYDLLWCYCGVAYIINAASWSSQNPVFYEQLCQQPRQFTTCVWISQANFNHRHFGFRSVYLFYWGKCLGKPSLRMQLMMHWFIQVWKTMPNFFCIHLSDAITRFMIKYTAGQEIKGLG